MIIKSCVLEKGKVCITPKKYYPNKEIFNKYAYYYQKDAEELYTEIKASVEEAQEEDISSEEEEDNEIRSTDRLAVSLVKEENDLRLDVYLYDEKAEAFYVHHDIFLHESPTSVAVLDRNEDPFVFISNEDGTISGYNLYVVNHFLPDVSINAHSLAITQIESYKDTLISIDAESLKGWDMPTQKSLFSSKKIDPTAISIDHNRIIYSSSNSVYLYDEKEGASTKIFGTETPISSIGFKGSLVAAGTASGEIYYARMESTSQPLRGKNHKGAINSIVVPTERYIGAAGEDESLSLFDTLNQEIVFRHATRTIDLILAVPRDDPSLFVYSLEDNELGIGFYNKELFKLE